MRLKKIMRENKKSKCIEEAENYRKEDNRDYSVDTIWKIQGATFAEYTIAYYNEIKCTIYSILHRDNNPINLIKREFFRRRKFFRLKGYASWNNYKMFDKNIDNATINQDFIELLKQHCAGLYPRCRLLEAKKVKETEKYTFYWARIEWNGKRKVGKFPKVMKGGPSYKDEERTCFICVRNGTKTFALSYSLYLDNKTVKYLTKVVNNKFLKLFSKNL